MSDGPITGESGGAVLLPLSQVGRQKSPPQPAAKTARSERAMGNPKSETSTTEPSANPFPKESASVDNITDPIEQAEDLRSSAKDHSSFMPGTKESPSRSKRNDLSVPSAAGTVPTAPGASEPPTAPGAAEPPANVRGQPEGTINPGTGMPKDTGQDSRCDDMEKTGKPF